MFSRISARKLRFILLFVWGMLFASSSAYALTADPATVAPGQATVLSYDTYGVAGCNIYDTSDWSTVATNVPSGAGSVSIIPANLGSNNYVMRCGTTQFGDAAVVVVDEDLEPPEAPTTPPTILSFTISPATINTTGTSILSWSVADASTCTASGNWSGEKSRIGGNETLAGLTTGTYSYTLVCENAVGIGDPKTVSLEVQPAPPAQITNFTISAASIVQGSAASLQWTAVNAQSCTRSGDWSGSTAPSNSYNLPPNIRNTPGNYSFTLTCTGGGVSDSQTVTLQVEAAEPEITLLELISLNQVSFPWWKDGDVFVLPQNAAVGIDRASRFTSSCELYIGNDPTNQINLPGQYAFNNPGQQDVVYTCHGHEGEGTVSRTLPIRVVPKPSITSFEANPASILSGENTTLNWMTQYASSCTVDGQSVDANGSLEVSPSFPGDGFVEYELSCAWTDGFEDRECLPGQIGFGCQKLAQTRLKTSVSRNEGLSGRYFGAFDLWMAQAPRPGESGLPLNAGRRLKEDGSNEPYVVLGHNQPNSLWMWDFDELNAHGTGKIYLGGSNLLALLSATPPMRLYSPDRLRIEGQHYPDEHPSLEDHIGIFTDRGDGTYDVRFNYQIFMGTPASYPLIKLVNRMRVTVDEHGILKVATLDYTELGPPDDAPDGIPGMRSPMAGEVSVDGSIAVVGDYFPARVSPQFYAKHMLKVDMNNLGANGLPKAVNTILRLDNSLADNDGDGVLDTEEIGENWALPLSTDSSMGPAYRDNVFDVLKPVQFIDPPHFIGQIALGNSERVVLYSEDPTLLSIDAVGTGYIGARYQELDPGYFGQPWQYLYHDPLPPTLPTVHPTNGLSLNYDLGGLTLRAQRRGLDQTGNPPEKTYSLYFNKGVPEGLVLIDLDSAYQNNYVVFPEVMADGHTVRFSLQARPNSGVAPMVLALGYTGEPRIFADGNKFDPNEPGYQTLLTQAAAWVPPDQPTNPNPVSIASFAPSAPTITLGGSVQLLWQAENAGSCSLSEGANLLHPALAAVGNYKVTPPAVGTYTYELICSGTGDPATATTTVVVQSGGTPVDPNLITGVWTGNFSLTMRTAPEGVVLGDSHDNYWIWNFDEGWAQFGRTDPGTAGQGMLSVGFPFHVQDIGNASSEHDRAYFTNNGDGTYTLHYGYQIYNPYVGNPRTDITTTFRITRSGERLNIVTLDSDSDGVPGVQVPGVFPLTVSPDFTGALAQDGSLDPDPGGPGTDPGAELIGTFAATPASVNLGQSFTLTWQAVRADHCTASGDWSGAKAKVGNESQSPASARLYVYTLTCTAGAESLSRTVTVLVGGGGGPTDPTDPDDPDEPVDPNVPGASNLSGVYLGEHMITMRGCPGVCAAGQEVVLGTGMKNSPWVWDFDKKTVKITGTTLTVGFNYEVQSVGNKDEGEQRLTAAFTDNGDGTYTVHHGFQIYNPNVGNPRADTRTTFRIGQDAGNPNLLHIVTLDGEADGIPGTQIVGVFPMTVQPDFRGTARKEGSSSAGDGIPDAVKEALGLNPDAANGDTDGDGIPDAAELGPDLEHPLDSDGDGVIDALEPGDAANDAARLAGVALLDGIPGRGQEGFPHAGTTVAASVAGGWSFTGADTGLMQVTADDDNAGAIPDTTLGDAGLDYAHGYVQVSLATTDALPAFGAMAAKAVTAALAQPVAEPVKLTFTYEAALPAADKLLVYATALVDGKERYTLMAAGDWRRIDAHTLEVTVQDNGERDLDGENGVLRVGVAPTANTLGGHDESSGNGGGGGSAGALLMLLALALLGRQALASRWMPRRRGG